MRFATLLLAAACALAPAGPADAAATPMTAAVAPVTVARYSFDGPGATVADLSGRGMPLRTRTVDGGAVRFVPRGTGRAAVLPARCPSTATRCPRVILEGGDDVDLDPGTRPFRYGAYVRATLAQIGTGANIMQKGVANTDSQWKMQVGRRGKANCVLVGQGSRTIYMAKASVRVADGRWHLVECRRAGSALTILVDGSPRGSVAVPPNVSVGNALPLRLGGRNLTSRADQYGGAIDEVYAVLG